MVTQSYTDFLRRHVSWEVTDYESNVFRGWTLDEARSMLLPADDESEDIPTVSSEVSAADLPRSLNWREKRPDCVHEVRSQGLCGGCWSFASAGVVSDRCCLRLRDYGWLSPQELIGCDKRNGGCGGGREYIALEYVAENGLVPEACFPYMANWSICPSKCADGSDWAKSHVCRCKTKVVCQGADAMKRCLQSGPITGNMWVYKDFMSYRSGVYRWSRNGTKLGAHAVRIYGYSSDPQPHWLCANSWSTQWGDQGLFRLALGEAGIEVRSPAYCDPYQS